MCSPYRFFELPGADGMGLALLRPDVHEAARAAGPCELRGNRDPRRLSCPALEPGQRSISFSLSCGGAALRRRVASSTRSLARTCSSQADDVVEEGDGMF